MLKLVLSTTYCNEEFDRITSANVRVAECIPHVNPDGSVYVLGEEFSGNPFLATHACCDASDWSLKDKDVVCYNDPDVGCYVVLL